MQADNGNTVELLTNRLLIRALQESDFPAFEKTLNEVQSTCMGSPKAFFDWIVSRYAAMDIENSLVSFGIFRRETGEFLGTVGVGDHDDLHEPEIFYELLPEHRGHGYATEAAKAVVEWAFEKYKLPYLIGTAGVENLKSQNVLERCGFQFIERKTLLVHVEGKRYDFKYYRRYPKPSAL